MRLHFWIRATALRAFIIVLVLICGMAGPRAVFGSGLAIICGGPPAHWHQHVRFTDSAADSLVDER